MSTYTFQPSAAAISASQFMKAYSALNQALIMATESMMDETKASVTASKAAAQQLYLSGMKDAREAKMNAIESAVTGGTNFVSLAGSVYENAKAAKKTSALNDKITKLDSYHEATKLQNDTSLASGAASSTERDLSDFSMHQEDLLTESSLADRKGDIDSSRDRTGEISINPEHFSATDKDAISVGNDEFKNQLRTKVSNEKKQIRDDIRFHNEKAENRIRLHNTLAQGSSSAARYFTQQQVSEARAQKAAADKARALAQLVQQLADMSTKLGEKLFDLFAHGMDGLKNSIDAQVAANRVA